ncbi:hypothetical protein IAU60_001024 [Kwoniella sp. DSM 27419]
MSATLEDDSMQPVASSSRQTLPSTPRTIPSLCKRLPRSVRRRFNRRVLGFLLALCLPTLASAKPLPATIPDIFRNDRIQNATSPAAMSFLQIRDGPMLAIASYDKVMENYRIPDGYVELVQVFNPGFIVLSYVIAFVGSLCTLELLIRRTTNSGWRNQVLLAAAGFCFGAVSTFAMHFVFNNALSLHHPMMDAKTYPALYLSYDPGFTILSLVVSCLAMTMAFFIMGTQLKDWLILPGHKRRDRLQRQVSPTKADADDYGKWKKQHKKIVRRGTMGVGALFATATQAAKWSLMDLDGTAEPPKPTSFRDKLGVKQQQDAWRDKVQGLYSPRVEGDDKMVCDDKALQELDFRYGKEAVRLELERRAGASSATSGSQPSSILQPPGSSGPPMTPLPIIYTASSRRESEGDIFSSGFDLKSEQVADPPRDASPIFDEPVPSYQPGGRRASLPANVLVTHRDRPSYSGPSTTLARIQSLPEDYSGSTTGSRSGSIEDVKVLPKPITNRLSSYRSSNTAGSERQRKVRLVGSSTKMTRLGMFLGFDVVTMPEIAKICITGTIAGLGVAGMHYIGQASITGLPYIAYKPEYVVGSIIIACGAVVIALYIMFIMLRPKLKHTWWSKIGVALILAVAVTCMHFCGMMGTLYAWPIQRGINRHTKLTGTNVVITGIVAALAFAACIACAVFFLLHSIKQRRERARRRRVVVAAVLLDDRDRVLVNSTDGTLPMCDIASLTGGDVPDSRRSFNQSLSSDSTVLGMDLTTGHDAFVSALKLSWTWKNPSLAPSQIALETKTPTSESVWAATLADIRRGSMITTNTTNSGAASKATPVSLTKFLERFTSSSCQLAVRLLGQADGISRLGVLYDQILTTGWVKLHNSNDTVSKGQLIFLVRRVASAAERTDLESRHFIFADPQAVASALQRTLSVPAEHTMPLLDDMRTFCDSTLHSSVQPGKLYAGVAVVQATPFDGLRILLEKDMRSQLPMREMCSLGMPLSDDGSLGGTVEEIGEALALLEGMTILSIISRNMTQDTTSVLSTKVAALLLALERAIVPMMDEMLTAEDMEHILPRLTLHPMLIPLTPGPTVARKTGSYVPPYAIIFYATYDAAVNTFTDKWLPFSLFRAQNACVMAPKITAATKMNQLYTASNSSENGFAASGARRTSKVQFEFPTSASRDVTPLSTPMPVEEGSSMFGGFTFPPKADDTVKSAMGHQRSSSIKTQGNGTTPNGPRRSSLARSRFGSMSGESADPILDGQYPFYAHGHASSSSHKDSSAVVFRTVSPGVAAWEQEWLLHLLRMKLRADA